MQTVECPVDMPDVDYHQQVSEWIFDNVLPYEQYQTVSVSLDWKRFDRKPTKPQFGGVNKRIGKSKSDVMLSELVTQIVQPYGQTWSAGIFDTKRTEGSKNSESWQEQQIFAMDFDNKKAEVVTFEKVQEICREYGLDICFAYTTFSSIAEERFRVVFVLPFVIYHEQLRNAVQKLLLYFFPEADQTCQDAARLITGGKDLLYKNLDARLKLEKLVEGVHLRWHQFSPNHISRKLKEISHETGISMVNGVLDVQWNHLDPYQMDGPDGEIVEFQEVNAFQKVDPVSTGSYTIQKSSNVANISYHIIYNYISGNSRHFVHFTFEVPSTLPTLSIPSTNSLSTPPSTPPPTPHTIGGTPTFLKNSNFKKLERVCPVFRAFVSQERKFTNPELFGIYTNLRFLSGGRKKFLEIIESSGHSYDFKRLEAMTYYIDRRNYRPMLYHHYADNWNPDYRSMYEASLPGYGEVRVISSIPCRRIDEVYQEIDSKINILLAGPIPGIHGFRAVTGLGKTRIITEIEGGCVIAFPRHDLIQEVADLFRQKGRTPIVMPQFPEKDVTEKFRDEIFSLWAIGAYAVAMMRIREAAGNESEPALREYVIGRDKVERAKVADVVLTTHQAVLREGVRGKVVIFDEDPISTALSIITVPEEDLQSFSGQLKKFLPPIRSINLLAPLDKDGYPIMPDNRTDEQKGYAEVDSRLRKILRKIPSDGVPYEIDPLTMDRERRVAMETIAMESRVSSNVLGLLECSHVICTETKDGDRSFTGIRKQTFPTNSCVIILSATIDEWIYRNVFGHLFKSFYDGGPVEPENGGRVIQYHQRSFSRTAIRSMGNIESVLTARFSDAEYRITFKEFKEDLHADAHFGAIAGVDTFKGKNGLIIGTPHLHPSVYLLYAAILTGPEYVYDTTMVKQQVERNGRKFWFYTYKDETLRNIHLHLVESELIQAVGRSRHLRESATVYVLSSLAIPGAEYRTWSKGDLELFTRR